VVGSNRIAAQARRIELQRPRLPLLQLRHLPPHPPELTVRKLLDDTRLPLDWSEQKARLGFAPQAA
jgi:hypothetical protein